MSQYDVEAEYKIESTPKCRRYDFCLEEPGYWAVVCQNEE